MIFDDYKEEINDEVSYGVLYTHRATTARFYAGDISPDREDTIVTLLKLEALKSIRDDINGEYEILKDKYEELNRVEIEG